MKIKQKIVLLLFVVFFLPINNLLSQTTTTSLKDPQQVQIFLEATRRIRCICLPSLPIQACSFNMCTASSYLKTFIENRIKEGMSADDIVSKMEHGFGEEILNDSVVKHFTEEGNQGMVNSIVYGFGPKILATPDSTWINVTLLGIGVLGLILIYFYFQRWKPKTESSRAANQSSTSDTNEIKEKIRKWENSEE
ncbi:cytochrome c-type biogenesis protein CcmH [Leptospira idonii]|uniref:cytochrome c-type biogenesis protein CcmH n=1 Tax=Leptospira idonii TaxID=1193500 RepID=UPI003CCC6FF6